jgi:AroM protein
MTGGRLGVVTFGPSGGADLAADLRAALPGVQVHETGLLDDVPAARLESWRAGAATADATVVHLGDGRELTIESAPLMARLGPVVDRLAAARPGAVLYGCAGPVPEHRVPGGAPAVLPRTVMRQLVHQEVPNGRVAIVVPSPLHVEATRRHYGGPGRLVDCRAASPANRDAVLAAVTELDRAAPELILLTCFDHTLADLRAAQAAARAPVMSGRLLALKAVRDLLAGQPR